MTDDKKKSHLSIIASFFVALLLASPFASNYYQKWNLNGVTSETIAGRTDLELDVMRSWDILEAELKKHTHDPHLTSINVVAKKIADYRSASTTALSSAEGLKIDLIGNLHKGAGGRMPESVESQRKAGILLERLNHDCIGVEGQNEEDYTRTARNLPDSLRKKFPIATNALIDRAIGEIMEQDAAFTYALKHPSASITGLEDSDLYDLSLGILKSFDNPAQTLGDPLFIALLDARTDFALTKMLTYMKKNKKTHGIIVFGLSHVDRFRELMQGSGIISTIYTTFTLDESLTDNQR